MIRYMWLAMSNTSNTKMNCIHSNCKEKSDQIKMHPSRSKPHLVIHSQLLTWNELILCVMRTPVIIDQSARGGTRAQDIYYPLCNPLLHCAKVVCIQKHMAKVMSGYESQCLFSLPLGIEKCSWKSCEKMVISRSLKRTQLLANKKSSPTKKHSSKLGWYSYNQVSAWW